MKQFPSTWDAQIGSAPFEFDGTSGLVATLLPSAAGSDGLPIGPMMVSRYCQLGVRPLYMRRLVAASPGGLAQVSVACDASSKGAFWGTDRWQGDLAGIQVLGVRPADSAEPAALCHALVRSAPGRSKEDAYRSLFGEASAELTRRGFAWKDVVRTWFYLPAIDEDYGLFNAIRSEAYAEAGLGPVGSRHPFPASTGVGGVVLPGRTCGVELLVGRGLRQKAFGNPSQAEAPSYGSAFTRAVCLGEGSGALVFVSGTAAIGTGGESLHRDDPQAQLWSTLGHLQSVLAGAGCELGDCVGGTLYARSQQALAACRPLLARHVPFPCVLVATPLCRPELLVEIEVVAVVGARSRKPR